MKEIMKELILKINELFTKKERSRSKIDIDPKVLWKEYKKSGLIWKHRIVKFVIANPEFILRDDKLWNEFKTYIKDLYLYDFKIDKNTDRLMVVECVKKNYNSIINDNNNIVNSIIGNGNKNNIIG